ncbi:oxidoreductase [Nonomuraea jabiensis]|uniref:oxidoreductase n=1 Tax=Nonomuraea jabiensis TaxID=882448 RepID=UPI0028AF1AF3|nr:hypothetical protein [Nonomuraea jabiensis]
MVGRAGRGLAADHGFRARARHADRRATRPCRTQGVDVPARPRERLDPGGGRRLDRYGGGFDNRVRLLLEVVDAVRGAWPAERPLLVRVSATDWVDGGWTPEETVDLARLLHGA